MDAAEYSDAELVELATDTDDALLQALAMSLLLARRKRRRLSGATIRLIQATKETL